MPRMTYRRVPAYSSAKSLTCSPGSSRTTSNRHDSRFADCLRRLTEQNFSRLMAAGRVAADRRAALIGTQSGGTAFDGLEPALQVRKVIKILPLCFVRYDPRIGRHVGNGVGAGDEFAIGETLIQHPV